jgi:hypothetical protein
VAEVRFEKHASEFPGLTQSGFTRLIRNTISRPSASKSLARGRRAWWNESEKTVVIYDPASPDLGTAFRPARGYSYYKGLK